MEIKFEWTPEISVNDEIIDNQHKKLLAKVNELLSAILDKKDNAVIGEIISFLGEYAKEHLLYEEGYMLEHLYPDFEEHKKIHEHFVDKYQEFENRFKKVGYTDDMSREVESFLGNWWLHHIGHEDKKYADFIEENEK